MSYPAIYDRMTFENARQRKLLSLESDHRTASMELGELLYAHPEEIPKDVLPRVHQLEAEVQALERQILEEESVSFSAWKDEQRGYAADQMYDEFRDERGRR
jgi:Mg2+ and Co2+ transporter CorA